MSTEQIDEAKAEAFADRFVGIIGGASLALMTSVGHRTGLFDAMAGLSPSTSAEIAQAAGLNERYVREWLGAMVVGEVIEYDPGPAKYRLPPEHAAFLTTAAGPDNLAYFTQYFPVLGNVEDEIVESFRRGGGVPYSSYPKFQELQAGETARVFDATLVDVTMPLVPGLAEQLESGIEVADVGTGAGHAINVLAKAFPNSRFVGYDFSDEGVAAGRAEAAEWGLTNATFEVKDVTDIAETERFELITAFDAIHDQRDPRAVLRNIAQALKPDGTFLMVDIAASSKLEENIGNPWAPLFYTWSTLHCMTVSLALGGEGLGTAWGEQKARELLTEAGFTQIEAEKVEDDPINVYFIARR
jgi:2-polyprenyl-3-methyl-5-hydroxy-6-metoxy-1,4-benzoquinol methylase